MDGGSGWLYKTAGMQHIPLVIHHSLTHPLNICTTHTDVILFDQQSGNSYTTHVLAWSVPVCILCAHG